MDALIDLGRPRSIQLAVLVDRPAIVSCLSGDYVVRIYASARDEKIKVQLVETDGTDRGGHC